MQRTTRFFFIISSLLLVLFGSTFVQAAALRSIAVYDVSLRAGETNLSTVHSINNMLDAAGVPYVITSEIDTAMQHAMLLVSTSVYAGILTSNDTTKLDSYVQQGGVLILQKVKEEDLYPLCGISGQVTAENRYTMRWLLSSNHPTLRWIDDPLEETISLGDEVKSQAVSTRSYTPTTAENLALFDDNSSAVVVNQYGDGFVYCLGFSLKDLILRNELNLDYSASRSYSNGFEPTSDTVILFFRAAYQHHVPFAPWKHTSLGSSTASLVITHDVDSTSSMEMMEEFALMESDYNATATYNITTHYIDDALAGDYYSSYVDEIKNVLLYGQRISSHSVGHFPDFADIATIPIGAPGNTRATYLPYNDGNKTIGATLYGELEVSKKLLQGDVGASVYTFRSGHLAFNRYQIEVLDALGYRYDSSQSANDVLTNFPYRCLDERSFSSSVSNIFELPMTISDVPYSDLDHETAVDDWLDIITKNFANKAPTVLLIHPNRQWKVDSEELLLQTLPSSIVATDMDSFGDFWRYRESVNMHSLYANGVLTLIFSPTDLPFEKDVRIVVENGQLLDAIMVRTEGGAFWTFGKIPWGKKGLLLDLHQSEPVNRALVPVLFLLLTD